MQTLNFKRLAIIGAALAGLGVLSATSASAATTTGTISLTGGVASDCEVVNGSSATSFADTFNTTELSTAGGTLVSGLSYTSATNLATLKVVCSGVAPTIKIKATSMTNASSAPTGYANQINFKAYLDTKLITTGGTTSTDTQSVTSTSAGATSGNAATTSKYLQNVANNVVVRADTFATPNAGDVLIAGPYAGSIVVTITP